MPDPTWPPPAEDPPPPSAGGGVRPRPAKDAHPPEGGRPTPPAGTRPRPAPGSRTPAVAAHRAPAAPAPSRTGPAGPAPVPPAGPAKAPAALTWSLLTQGRAAEEVPAAWGGEVTAEWAWGGATGRGVKVCVVDSGVESGHPMIGPVDSSWVVAPADGVIRVTRTEPADVCGHGSACAGIIRSLAPECEIHSVRVLGEGFGGTGDVFVAGLRWAVEQGFDVINLSLSTSRPKYTEPLREVADDAFFGGSVVVASAHNMRVESFPWRFSSVISVGSHDVDDPDLVLYNPSPPVEFFAQGQNVEVAWRGGARTRTTGNSFATPRITGLCALIRSKHPRVTAFQLKNILYLTAANVRGES